MAFLKNRNGENYKVLGVRKSSTTQPNDYLVQSKGGQFIIAHGWDSKNKCWEQGGYYGWGEAAEKAAKKDFYGSNKRK